MPKKAARWIGWLRTIGIFVFFVFPHQASLAATCGNKSTSDFRILLDVGHTAAEPGATSARGVPEYEFNMKLARRIEEELIRSGFHSTQVLVIHEIGQRGLGQRSALANDMKADLFLSIHHDSAKAEYLTTWRYEGNERRFSDQFQGFSLFVSRENKSYAESLRFARALADRLLSAGLSFTTHHEETNPAGAMKPFMDSTRGIYANDELSVLMFSEMPAVLFEAGVIVNRGEELLLSSPAHRGTIAKAVADAVMNFCNNWKGMTYKVIKVVAGDVLNIRSGPAPHHPIVGSIGPNGRGVRIVSACEGEWCPVDYNGIHGWANGWFLTPE